MQTILEKPVTPVITPTLSEKPLVVIEPIKTLFATGLRELWEYRDLLYFFTWRDVKVRYKQTILGASWAILQPLMTMIVFSVFFGGLAQLPSDGIPYPIFSFVGLVPFTFFSAGLQNATNSIITNANMLKKIYFPRLIIPVSSIVSGMVDFLLAFGVLLIMIIGYLIFTSPQTLSHVWNLLPLNVSPMNTGIHFGINIIWIPLLMLLAIAGTLGMGIWFSALNVQFRDMRHAIGFILRIWQFITPIVYPASMLSPEWRIVCAFNPMTGVVEGFRWALLGTTEMPLDLMVISACVSAFLIFTGLLYFNRMERTFADVV